MSSFWQPQQPYFFLFVEVITLVSSRTDIAWVLIRVRYSGRAGTRKRKTFLFPQVACIVIETVCKQYSIIGLLQGILKTPAWFFNIETMNLRSRIFIWNTLFTFSNKINLMNFKQLPFQATYSFSQYMLLNYFNGIIWLQVLPVENKIIKFWSFTHHIMIKSASKAHLTKSKEWRLLIIIISLIPYLKWYSLRLMYM